MSDIDPEGKYSQKPTRNLYVATNTFMKNKVPNLQKRNKTNTKKGKKKQHEYDVMLVDTNDDGSYTAFFPHQGKADFPRRHLQYPTYKTTDKVQCYDPEKKTWEDCDIVAQRGFFIFNKNNSYVPVWQVKRTDNLFTLVRANHIRKKF